MATKVVNSGGIKLLVNEVDEAIGVSPRGLIKYYKWKAGLKEPKIRV